MSFLELNWIFLGLALAAVVVALLARRVPRGAAAAAGLSIAALWVLTAVFDNVMIASGLFDYGGHTLAGLRIGLAPIEDFAYPLGAALLLPAVWLLLTGGPRRRRAGKTGRGGKDR
ncbi:lycopene cyclase domain-containing protein [Arthrobacter sulfonylureivorans]|uniref:lycopene cyclase domain-containing protein n=1 Tax=Arthrobacter sulfonylureivorans TaxID=2486855 RepID=UPI0039E6C222